MRILLVNNNTKHLDKFGPALSNHQVEIQAYKPGLDFHHQDKDLVILSGGRGKEMHDEYAPGKLWYEDEMNFALACDKPIIGICMGFEIIAAAHGSKIEANPDSSYEVFLTKRTTPKGSELLQKEELFQFSAHHWCARDVSSKHFQVLADSDNCIEMIRHKTRPIIATQFHPEFPGGTLKLQSLLQLA